MAILDQNLRHATQHHVFCVLMRHSSMQVLRRACKAGNIQLGVYHILLKL